MSEHRLVVGVDGGAAALRAVDWAARECAARDATLILVHALGHGADTEPADAEQVLAGAEAEARSVAADGSIDVRRRPERGAPAEVLVVASATAQLVVLGNNGVADVANSLLGTVGHRVGTHAHCPVVIVPSAASPERAGGPVAAGPVVVGLVPGRTGREALRFALAYGAGHALPVVGVCAGEDAESSVLPAGTEAVLAEWPRVEFSLRRVDTDPVTALGAQCGDAALLVLGCHHSDEPWSARLGPVPSALLDRSPVPIALVGAVDTDD